MEEEISITEHSKTLKISSPNLRKDVLIKVYSDNGSYCQPSFKIKDIINQEELKFINDNIPKILFRMKKCGYCGSQIKRSETGGFYVCDCEEAIKEWERGIDKQGIKKGKRKK